MAVEHDLYRQNGGPPAPLPTGLVLDDDGNAWSDLANNPEGLAATGHVKAPAYPSDFNPALTTAIWDAETADWLLEDIPPAPETPIEDVRAAAIAQLASDRWTATQAFTYLGHDGVYADTALTAVTAKVVLIRELIARGEMAETDTFYFKMSPAIYLELNIDGLVDYGKAINDQIQGAFNMEAVAALQIGLAEDAAAVQAVLDGIAWPGQ